MDKGEAGATAVGGGEAGMPSPAKGPAPSAAASRQMVRRAVAVLLEDDYVVDALGKALLTCGFSFSGPTAGAPQA